MSHTVSPNRGFFRFEPCLMLTAVSPSFIRFPPSIDHKRPISSVDSLSAIKNLRFFYHASAIRH